MNEDFYNSVHFELASEIGQKAVIIATLQAQLKNCREYTQSWKVKNKTFKRLKMNYRQILKPFKKKKKNFKTNSMN